MFNNPKIERLKIKDSCIDSHENGFTVRGSRLGSKNFESVGLYEVKINTDILWEQVFNIVYDVKQKQYVGTVKISAGIFLKSLVYDLISKNIEYNKKFSRIFEEKGKISQMLQ